MCCGCSTSVLPRVCRVWYAEGARKPRTHEHTLRGAHVRGANSTGPSSSVVEHTLGKGEVVSSILTLGSAATREELHNHGQEGRSGAHHARVRRLQRAQLSLRKEQAQRS